ncbi:hypothetical protein [Streptomyces sp. VRA16 Mangrove soil]|uniref:hypothetical protein n=1 Tax=Streptomyces sp. VRA16 Mangrove soil TaxID=2817434 RepID=UPI001A9E731C|nr:hypothetical protein [Streptomyces sp. VRA16 Mangrove soil]MBO1330020.1 hypothetical protein [Streptomyces sp. VRA16 Mangrove soil]
MAAPAHHTIHTFKEYHWLPERHGTITELCEAAAEATPQLRSVSHYSNGILDFVVCRTERSPLSSAVAESGGDAQDEALPGSRLLLCTEDLDARLHRLRTGDLMRTVVAGPAGGLWGGRVKPGEYLAAVADASADVAAMDRTMNALASRIRSEVHDLPPELLGGEELRNFEAPRPSAQLRIDLGTGADQNGAYEQRLRSLWGAHLSVTDLQYAAFYRDLTLVCVGDVFEDEFLGPRFMDVGIRARRTAYQDLTRTLRGHLARLADALEMVGAPGGTRPPMNRLVLDVQEGAVYFLWPSPREFVIGVTLNQTRVGQAEARLRALAGALHGLRA